jgi:hypothetical protein
MRTFSSRCYVACKNQRCWRRLVGVGRERPVLFHLSSRVFAPHRLGLSTSEGCFFRCRGLFPLFDVTPQCGFQLPTNSAPTMAPSAMSVRRDSPRHMTVLPRTLSVAEAGSVEAAMALARARARGPEEMTNER